jgi:hypothetical protein
MSAQILECPDRRSRELIGFSPAPEVKSWYKNIPLKSRGQALNNVIQLGIECEQEEGELLTEVVDCIHLINQRINELETQLLVLQKTVILLANTLTTAPADNSE